MSDKTARIIALSIVVVTGLLVVASAFLRISKVREPHIDIDRSRYPVVGIDLSAHNGDVCFDSLARAGVDFVYLKATEGRSFRDRNFARNFALAREAGLAVGAYHFFRFDCDGASQSLNILNAVDGLDPDLPLAIDVEEWHNAPQVTTATIRERLGILVAMLRAKGHKVIVYSNKQGFARFVRGGLSSQETPELWICSFTSPPLGREDWRLWQHSHKGRLPGVKGSVDLNTFNGSRDCWQAWLDSCRTVQ